MSNDFLVIQVQDSNLSIVQALFQIPITSTPQPTITTTSPLPQANQGVAYTDTMAATGGTPPYTWSLISATGTNSWSVNSSGVVSGTPVNYETDVLFIQVTDSLSQVSAAHFNLQVLPAPLMFSPAPLPTATDGIFYSQLVTFTNGTGPFTLLAGPVWMTLTNNSPTTATVSGLPTGTGTVTVTFQSTV